MPEATGTFTITPRGPFSLDQAGSFGFGPREAESGEAMRLSFAADGSGSRRASSCARRDGTIEGEVHGDTPAEPRAIRSRASSRSSTTARSGRGSAPATGDRALQADFPGLRPVLFHSPYEAAAWAVIVARRAAHRPGMCARARRALRRDVRARRRAARGVPLGRGGARDRRADTGLTNEKRLRLQGIARAELDGRLDVAHLRELGPDAARAELQQLRGIGPFSSSLVVLRAVGFTDVLPVEQPMVQRAVERAYEITSPLGPEQFAALAEPWRPFRTWACVLLRVAGERAR